MNTTNTTNTYGLSGLNIKASDIEYGYTYTIKNKNKGELLNFLYQDEKIILKFHSEIISLNKNEIIWKGNQTTEYIKKMKELDNSPLLMGIIVLQDLFVYHLIDCSSIIDLFQYISKKEEKKEEKKKYYIDWSGCVPSRDK
jgi:hypothetical protein